MANFNLNDFRKKLDRDFGPFVIEWGEEGKEKSVEIAPLLIASAKQQVEFQHSFIEISLIATGNVGTDNNELLERLIDWKPGDPRSEEEVAIALIEKATDNAKNMLRNLASNKRDFDSFAKAFNGGLMEWFLVLTEYCGKYNLFGVGTTEGDEGK